MDYINKIITVFFLSIPGNIARGESANQASEVSAMTEGNNPSTD